MPEGGRWDQTKFVQEGVKVPHDASVAKFSQSVDQRRASKHHTPDIDPDEMAESASGSFLNSR